MTESAPHPRANRTGEAPPEPSPPPRSLWRGIVELATVTGQAILALSEIFRPRRDDVDTPTEAPGRSRPHPVEKSAPFPIND